MSDPMKQMEIEDVLSSIRRLVADESAHRDHAAASAPAPADSPDSPDKLLLTPALRVSGEDVVMPPAADSADGTPLSAAPQDRWANASLEDRIAELEAAVAGTGDEWEPDGSETPRSPEIRFEDFESVPQAVAPVAPADMMQSDAPDAPVVQEQVFDGGQDDVIEMDQMPQMDIAPEPVYETPPMGGALHDEATGVTQPPFDAPQADSAPEPLFQAPPMTTFGPMDGATEPLAEAPMSMPADEAPHWSDAPAAQDAASMEDAPDMDRAAMAQEASMHDAPEDEPMLEPEIDDDADDVHLFDGEDDEDVLDEEMLRQLISDIVREELQGALGERITRNVRKLVRREINRALASRDFD